MWISQKIRLWRYFFLRCSLLSFTGITASYSVLALAYDRSPVGPPFFFFMKVIAYWDTHPLAYIAVICSTFGLLAASWAASFGFSIAWLRAFQILGVVIASIYLSSIACGLLWSLHDMQAGYFPTYPRLAHKLWGDALTGFHLGPRVVGNSFPLNVIALALGYCILETTSRQPAHRPELAHDDLTRGIE